jgi:aminodeoxyfutalosine synthase
MPDGTPQSPIEEWTAELERADLADLGRRALAAKMKRFGDRVFWVRNVHVNYTNVCRGECRVCRYSKRPGREGGYVLTPDAIFERTARAVSDGAVEVHIVGGIHPELAFSYYLDLVGRLRRSFPALFIKAFTAPEIDGMAGISGLQVPEVLSRLMAAGLDSLAGGGAEIFSPRVRRELFPNKISGDEWLDIHRTAHRMGLRTTATMLFGHIETPAERVEHLVKLRELQDETGGFTAFVPLPVVGYGPLGGVDGLDALRTLALSRLVLDNVEHVKVFWPIWGMKLAQLALSYGADDLDGTVGDYKIVDRPGSTAGQIRETILQAGLHPAERDGRYNILGE